jgi:NDP-sugar pyrophosphorylase family protein
MMVDFHRSCKACLTIAVQRKTINVEFGVLTTDAEGLVTNYIEKPNFDYIISMGVYVCEPVVLTYIPIGEYFDFNTLVIKLIKMNKKVVVFYSDAYWIDLGRPEDLQRATNWFMANKGRFLPCTLDDGFQPDKV